MSDSFLGHNSIIANVNCCVPPRLQVNKKLTESFSVLGENGTVGSRYNVPDLQRTFSNVPVLRIQRMFSRIQRTIVITYVFAEPLVVRCKATPLYWFGDPTEFHQTNEKFQFDSIQIPTMGNGRPVIHPIASLNLHNIRGIL